MRAGFWKLFALVASVRDDIPDLGSWLPIAEILHLT
jgi:hypothetical protein